VNKGNIIIQGGKHFVVEKVVVAK